MNVEDLQIIKDYEAQLEAIYDNASIKVMLRIQELWPKVQQVQPTITGFNCGMGTCSFTGKAIGISTEDGKEGEPIEINCVDIADRLIEQFEGNNHEHFSMAICDELYEIILMLDFIVDDNGLSVYDFENGYWKVRRKDQDYGRLKKAGLNLK